MILEGAAERARARARGRARVRLHARDSRECHEINGGMNPREESDLACDRVDRGSVDRRRNYNL
jgi:hypothetical protein